jgi:hypothetical protein
MTRLVGPFLILAFVKKGRLGLKKVLAAKKIYPTLMLKLTKLLL